ncbi:type II toxin-antitoxin system RelE/ParE family toxin [Aequorivita todarodis]|uniref:type II toxin-antitoxin system RelE/ParE family toxin n=1 Tax=Aequorivita todarodis TaxID=2036821 RepID=UPI00234FB64C|nr:type II toxin-antitoxin system RelE/ParE family toxin [Aequorivita todarodis]MDC8000868.1 type II toxin-antitoxin system RelE/ParE family toxin [Aequorivita todarodis]
MKIKILRSFSNKLADQVEYIAEDKPFAAKKFRKDVLNAIKDLKTLPYKQRKSIYFEDEHIRDLIFKGYTIVYRIKNEEQIIEVFGFVKYKESL